MADFMLYIKEPDGTLKTFDEVLEEDREMQRQVCREGTCSHDFEQTSRQSEENLAVMNRELTELGQRIRSVQERHAQKRAEMFPML